MQKVVNYCDVDLFLWNNEIADGVTSQTIHLGEGPMVIEICPKCLEGQNLTVAQLRTVLENVGRESEPPRVEAPAQPARRGGGQRGKPMKRGVYPCRFCKFSGTTAQAQGLHEFGNHPFQRLLWEEQNDWVRTHKVDGRRREMRIERLAVLARAGISLEEAARREAAIPTPFVSNFGSSNPQEALERIMQQAS